MTIFDNRKAHSARGEGAAPRGPRLTAARVERSGVATLSFARCRLRGPPIAG